LIHPHAGIAEDPAIATWGDRLYGHGESEDMPAIRTEVVESFDAESGWSCSMGADEGYGSVRSFPSGGGRALGLKVVFLKRSPSSVLLSPARPILVDPRCIMLSVRALGRNFPHELSVVVLDYYGQAFELPLGRLDFTGWKTLKAYVPRFDPATGAGIVQDDPHYTRPAGLRIAGLKIAFEPEDAYGSFFAYFTDIEATIEGLGPALPPATLPRAAPSEPGSAAPAAPAKEVSRGDLSAELAANISAALEARKTYPETARRRGVEGIVRLRLRLSADGRLLAATLAASSGSALLDRAALELASSVFPLDNIVRLELELVLAVNYSLKE
jgi:TonB family protein